jgi:SAM-dependent methyltransferase
MSSSTYSTAKSDSNSYEDGYNIFLRRSDFREKVLGKYDELVVSFIKKQTNVSVLDIGCGNGNMTARYLVELKKVSESLKVFLSEPAAESLKEALEILKEYKPTPYEEVKNLDLKFNHIIASYVFYHLDPEVMNNLVEKLESKGTLAIMMGTSDHPLKSHPVLKKLTSHGSSDRLTPFLERLGSENKYNISRYKIDTFLDLSNLWNEESFTEEAKTLLSFSLNKNFDELPKEATDALNEIFNEAFKSAAGKIKSVHEIIFIERKA